MLIFCCNVIFLGPLVFQTCMCTCVLGLSKSLLLPFPSCDRLLSVLFTNSSHGLELDLIRISTSIQRDVLGQIVSTVGTKKGCPNLTEMVLCGGVSGSEDLLLSKVDSLCSELRRHAPSLKRIHLPVASNRCFRLVRSLYVHRPIAIRNTNLFLGLKESLRLSKPV